MKFGLNKETGIVVGSVAVLSAIGVIVYFIRSGNQAVIDNIMNAAKAPLDPLTDGGANYGDYRDLGISEIFNRTYAAKNNLPVSISIGTAAAPGNARKYAKIIYEADGIIENDQSAVVGVFRSLKYKADVSKLADAFFVMYNQDLYSFLTSGNWLSGGCSPEEEKCKFGSATNYLKQIFDIIKTKP